MATTLTLKANTRVEAGTCGSRRLRSKGFFPGIVYGNGKTPRTVQLNEHEFLRATRAYTSEHILLDLLVDDAAPTKVLLQEIQHNPVTGKVQHVDFLEVSMTKKLRVEIPLNLVGIPVGVSQKGGVLEHLVRAIEIECLPADLMEHIDVNVEPLDLNQGLMVRDIQLDAAKYTIITHGDIAVASVSEPREEEVVATPEATAAAAAGPEVIREKKAEGEEGAAAEGAKGEAAKGDAKAKEPKKEAKK